MAIGVLGVPANMEHKNFSVDARTVLMLGRDSIKDPTTAVLELVKNSYDADATKVEIDIMSQPESSIRISDNGSGMSEQDVDDYWLRLGFSQKRVDPLTERNRRKTGEKGIGRISADRLGSVLELRTRAATEEGLCLMINWDAFNRAGTDLVDVRIPVISNPEMRIPKLGDEDSKLPSGTELIIRKLRQRWTAPDIRDLYDELSVLTPPFKNVVKDFEIVLSSDIPEAPSGRVQSGFLETPQLDLEADFDRGGRLSYTILEKGGKRQPEKNTMAWSELVQKTDPARANAKPQCGPVSIRLLFFPRKAGLLDGTKYSLSDLREFLDKNAGIKIYRDSIFVKPYGDAREPEGDWLGLAERKSREPAGAGRATFRIGANQVVGAVFLTRDANRDLIDSTSREGLIHGDAFRDLRSLVLSSLTLLEAHYHETFSEGLSSSRQASPSLDIKSLQQEFQNFGSELGALQAKLPKGAGRQVERTRDAAVQLVSQISRVNRSIEEIVSEATVFRGLATLGIAAAVFGHEIQSAIDETLGAAEVTRLLLRKLEGPKLLEALAEADKVVKYAEQVNAWGAFALARVKRDKRRRKKVSITGIIEHAIEEIETAFSAANIKIEKRLSHIDSRGFPMDIEAILFNLLTNAYTACTQIRRPRRIRVRLQAKDYGQAEGFELSVADTGPGVPEKMRQKIWLPLFSTKVDAQGKQVGTGLGLTIIRSIVRDLKGRCTIAEDKELGGARFIIWLPRS